MSGHPTNLRVKLPLLCALLQLATVLLFAFFVQYDSHTSPRLWHEEVQLHSKGPLDNEFYPRYPTAALTGISSELSSGTPSSSPGRQPSPEQQRYNV